MSLFEGLSKVISETSATAVSKTKELARIAQLNGAISDEEKIIAAAHTEIGRRYMENLAGERPDLFGDQVERIREALDAGEFQQFRAAYSEKLNEKI